MSTYLKLTGTPFSDDDMEWDVKIHMYTLLEEYMKERFGSTFFGILTKGDITVLLDEVRDQMYRHIKAESRRENWDVIEYRIAKMNWRSQYQARTDLREAMIAQVKYALRSGGDMLGDHHGTNLKKGQTIQDWHEIRRKLQVSTGVDEILRDGDQSLIMVQILTYDVDPDDYRDNY